MVRRLNCEGFSRRDCLKLGLGGWLGAGFVPALAARANADDAAPIAAKAKGCILIWMDGGPTHFETFDPKPNAPAEIRGEFDTVATKQPGVHYSEHMQRLAEAELTTIQANERKHCTCIIHQSHCSIVRYRTYNRSFNLWTIVLLCAANYKVA